MYYFVISMHQELRCQQSSLLRSRQPENKTLVANSISSEVLGSSVFTHLQQNFVLGTYRTEVLDFLLAVRRHSQLQDMVPCPSTSVLLHSVAVFLLEARGESLFSGLSQNLARCHIITGRFPPFPYNATYIRTNPIIFIVLPMFRGRACRGCVMQG